MKLFSVKPASIIASSIVAVFSGSVLAVTPPAYTDLDGDGVISEAEVSQIRDSHRATMLSEYDVNGDGELSRLERREAKDARHEQMVQQYDADGDGELSRDERKAARKARHSAIEAQFDVNQDGTLSDEERAGLDSVRQRHGKGRGKDRQAGRKHRGERGSEVTTKQLATEQAAE